MAAEYYRKSGQIPAFGDWESANELPLTQYFECARQAGLLRCSCSGYCGASYGGAAPPWGGAAADLYGVGFDKPLPRRVYDVPQRKTSGISRNYVHPKEQRKQVKVRDLMDHPQNKQKQYSNNGNLVLEKSSITVKPVDEDLYKIPSEVLENSKRVSFNEPVCVELDRSNYALPKVGSVLTLACSQKKMLGFFSRCMVPPCAA